MELPSKTGQPNDNNVAGTNSWFIITATLIKPLYQTHLGLVLESGYIYTDETIIRVPGSSKRRTTHQG